jgi:hypothetical protein
MNNYFKRFLLTAALLISSSAAFAVSLPGIPASGPLSFDFSQALVQPTSIRELLGTFSNNNASITNFGTTSVFEATTMGDFIFTDVNGSLYDGTNGTFQLDAQYNSGGTLIGGTVSITGQINGIGINNVQSLMTADLSSFATSGNLLGYATTNVTCNAAYADDCFANESVYLTAAYNGAPIDPNNLISQQFLVSSLTTVPVPASLWLLASALGLLGLRSKKKAKTA